MWSEPGWEMPAPEPSAVDIRKLPAPCRSGPGPLSLNRTQQDAVLPGTQAGGQRALRFSAPAFEELACVSDQSPPKAQEQVAARTCPVWSRAGPLRPAAPVGPETPASPFPLPSLGASGGPRQSVLSPGASRPEGQCRGRWHQGRDRRRSPCCPCGRGQALGPPRRRVSESAPEKQAWGEVTLPSVWEPAGCLRGLP